MKSLPFICVAIVLLAGPARGLAQAAASSSPSSGGIPISQLIAAVAKKSGKKFVLEPHVQAEVNLGPDPSRLSYEDLLTVLQVYGFVAIERGDTILVFPEAIARTLPTPLVAGNEKHPDAEVVTRIIHVRAMPAPQLVPLLRPLVPQLGHLAAVPCTNDLILVDRFANTKRIESIVQALDKGEAYSPAKCTEPPPERGPG